MIKTKLQFFIILLVGFFSFVFVSQQSVAHAQACEGGFCIDEPASCNNLENHSLRSSNTCASGIICCPINPFDAIQGPTDETFDALNPLVTEGSPVAEQLSTPGGIVSRVLEFLFPIAGLVLFVMLIWGGFEILVKSSQGTKGLDAGKNRITAAIVGFLLLFATYWMAQIIETIFGIAIV